MPLPSDQSVPPPPPPVGPQVGPPPVGPPPVPVLPVSTAPAGAPPDAAPPFDPTRPPGPPPFWAYTPSPPLPPARPRWGRARRLCTVVAVLGVLLVVAAAVVGVQAYRDARTPAAAVRAYFDALARGDAAAALAAGAVPEGGRALVTDAVLRANLETAPIDDVVTGAVELAGDRASVAVRYRLGGATPQEVDDLVAVQRVDGRWRLLRSAVPVVLSVDDAASWAAVPADPAFAVPGDTQLVFPGAVPVAYRTPLLTVTADSRVVRLSATGESLDVVAAVTTTGREALVRTVVAALQACVAGGSDVDAFCPQPPAGREQGVVLRAVPQSFTGTLTGVDALDLDVAVDPAAAGTFTVNGSIRVDGSWRVLDYDNIAQERSGAATVTFGATVAVGASGSLTWQRA